MGSPRQIQHVSIMRIQRMHALPSFHIYFVTAENRRAALAGQSPNHYQLVITPRRQKMAIIAPSYYVYAS